MQTSLYSMDACFNFSATSLHCRAYWEASVSPFLSSALLRVIFIVFRVVDITEPKNSLEPLLARFSVYPIDFKAQ